MKYTARDESSGNYSHRIARGKAECYICHDTHQELYAFIQSGSALSVTIFYTYGYVYRRVL